MWNQHDNGTSGGWGMMNGDGGAFSWVLALLMVLLLAAIIVTAVVAIQRFRAPRALQAPPGARGVLDERFARGEIDEDEYLRRRTVMLDT